MLEKITYINHLNEVVEFGNGEIFANYNDLRNYDWSVISKNNKISGFKKGIVKKTLPIKIKAKTEEEGIACLKSLKKMCYQKNTANL